MMSLQKKVLDFWFGSGSDAAWMKERVGFWFGGTDEINDRIRDLFADDLAAASRGEHDHLAATAQGRLALIVLLDQFTRNIYRKTGRMFDNDSKSLALALEGIELGHDQAVPPVWRMFFFMPLEHSEDLAIQERSVALFTALGPEVEALAPGMSEQLVSYAVKHRDAIAEYGRFPHRNALLGRESTAAEQAYLDGGGGFI